MAFRSNHLLGRSRGGADALRADVRIYDPERDREAKFRFGQNSAVAATGLLALAAWHLGAVERARELMDEAVAHAVETAHVPTLASRYSGQGLLEMLRDDAVAGRRAAEAAVALGREHGLTLYRALAELNLAWARAKLGDRNADPTELRQAVEAYASGQQAPTAVLLKDCSRKSRPSGVKRKRRSPGSTSRWRWRARPESIRSTPNCIAFAAKSSLNKTRPTPPTSKPPSSLPSLSRNGKRPAVSSCAPRCRSPSSINPPAARTRPPTCWGRRWKDFRRRRSLRRSRRPRRCSRRSPICESRRTRRLSDRYPPNSDVHLPIGNDRFTSICRKRMARPVCKGFVGIGR